MIVLLLVSSYHFTQARLLSMKTARTNISLNKGSVHFSDSISDSNWKYVGNYKEFKYDQETKKTIISIDDISMTDYQNVPINGDLLNQDGTPLALDKSKIITSNTFKNVKQGDTFYRVFDIEYKKDDTRNNPAVYTINMTNMTNQDENTKENNFQIIGKYYVIDPKAQKTDREIFNSGALFYSSLWPVNDSNDKFIKNGQTLRIMVLLRFNSDDKNGTLFEQSLPTITIDAHNYLQKIYSGKEDKK